MTDVLSLLWHDRATVTVRKPYIRDNKSTGFREEVTIQDLPCKLSHFNSVQSSNSPNENDGVVSKVVQDVKLLLAPDVEIPAGSKIAVTQKNGKTTLYTYSSPPAIFTNHQEINLELFQKWA